MPGSCGSTTALWRSRPLPTPPRPGSPTPSRCGTAGTCRSHESSLDHLVNPGKNRWRHDEAERLGGLEIDHQLGFDRLLNRHVGGVGALENPVDEDRGAPEQVA